LRGAIRQQFVKYFVDRWKKETWTDNLFIVAEFSVLCCRKICWWKMHCNIISCSEGVDSCQWRGQHQLNHWLEFQKYVFFLAWVMLWCFYAFHQAVNPSLFVWQVWSQERTEVNTSVHDLFVLLKNVSWNFWLHISLRLKGPPGKLNYCLLWRTWDCWEGLGRH
jgi:hypothetical protein